MTAALTAGAIAAVGYGPADGASEHAAKSAGRVERTEAAPTPTVGPNDPTPTAPNGTRLPRTSNPTTGPGLTGPGINLVATPNPDGSFEVSETVFFRSPRTSVTLAAPNIAAAAQTFAGKRPRADLVQLSSAGQPVLTGPVSSMAKTIKLPMATSRIELRYLLTNASVRSIPSVTGRALGLISPLAAATDRDLPTRLEIAGPTIRNLICPKQVMANRQCAGKAEVGVPPRMAAGNAVVVVQYNLPKPS